MIVFDLTFIVNCSFFTDYSLFENILFMSRIGIDPEVFVKVKVNMHIGSKTINLKIVNKENWYFNIEIYCASVMNLLYSGVSL